MGDLTRAAIISQGMQMAGKSTTAIAAYVGVEWDAWLKSVYRGWMWPILTKQASGISLTAGATSLTIGAGSGGINDAIQEVYDPLFIYTSDYRTRGTVRVRNLRGGDVNVESSVLDSSTVRGMPQTFKVRAGSTQGKRVLTPYPFPDRAYLLSIDYKYIPAASLDGEVPLYENDRTLIYAAKVFTLQHMKDPTWVQEFELLSALVSQDRGQDGVGAGLNQTADLDTRTFK